MECYGREGGQVIFQEVNTAIPLRHSLCSGAGAGAPWRKIGSAAATLAVDLAPVSARPRPGQAKNLNGI